MSDVLHINAEYMLTLMKLGWVQGNSVWGQHIGRLKSINCMVKGREMVICYQDKRNNYGSSFGRNKE